MNYFSREDVITKALEKAINKTAQIIREGNGTAETREKQIEGTVDMTMAIIEAMQEDDD